MDAPPVPAGTNCRDLQHIRFPGCAGAGSPIGPMRLMTGKACGMQERAEMAPAAPESGIGEVMKYGRGRRGLIPLWAGEGDLPTPPFIVEAATRSLAAGE